MFTTVHLCAIRSSWITGRTAAKLRSVCRTKPPSGSVKTPTCLGMVSRNGHMIYGCILIHLSLDINSIFCNSLHRLWSLSVLSSSGSGELRTAVLWCAGGDSLSVVPAPVWALHRQRHPPAICKMACRTFTKYEVCFSNTYDEMYWITPCTKCWMRYRCKEVKGALWSFLIDKQLSVFTFCVFVHLTNVKWF